MTPYLLRLDDEDQKHRHQLEAHYRKLHGRPVSFAEILRRILAEKAAEVRSTSASTVGANGSS
jgi:hypothetical protein